MWVERFKRRFVEFYFRPQSNGWISILRIGMALQVILFVLALRNDWIHLLSGGERGLIGRDLTEAVLDAESPLIPRLGWLVTIGNHLGASERTLLSIVWIGLLVSGCFLLAGFFCRPAAIAAWFLHLCVVKSANYLAYGVDNLTTVSLFYLMISPLPDRMSLDWQLRRRRTPDPRIVGFSRRLVQIHLCLIYLFGGIAKLSGTGWWNGTNLWRALTLPPFNFVDPQFLLRWKVLLPAAGLFICLLEIGYPFFIWSRRTRTIWLICICVMHGLIGLTMGMYLFALIMLILNLAAFGPMPMPQQTQEIEKQRGKLKFEPSCQLI
jgi:hypothetical protein